MDSSTRFSRGDFVTVRDIIPEESGPQVGFTYSAIVLEDSSDAIVTYQPVGGPVATRTGARGGPGDRNIKPGGWDGGYSFREWLHTGVVRVHRDGDEWSVWRWIDSDSWHPTFYVNLETPWRHTALGFDTHDWVLDLVVTVTANGFEISYKDEDELEWHVEEGLISAAESASIRETGARAFAAIERREWPLNADWDRWLPDATWGIPPLAGGWQTP